MNTPRLLGHRKPGRKKSRIEYMPGVNPRELFGKCIATFPNSDEVYGPFETAEEAVAWSRRPHVAIR
jgi:hypothetical protein